MVVDEAVAPVVWSVTVTADAADGPRSVTTNVYTPFTPATTEVGPVMVRAKSGEATAAGSNGCRLRGLRPLADRVRSVHREGVCHAIGQSGYERRVLPAACHGCGKAARSSPSEGGHGVAGDGRAAVACGSGPGYGGGCVSGISRDIGWGAWDGGGLRGHGVAGSENGPEPRLLVASTSN